MEGDADSFRSEKMEGEREDGGWLKISEGEFVWGSKSIWGSKSVWGSNFRGSKSVWGKQKKEKTKGIFKKFVLITVGSEAAFFKNAA